MGRMAYNGGEMRRRPLPTGTVTFLFTDIEGSTALWERDDAAMRTALAKHDAIVRRAVETAGGCVFKTVGDAAHCAFTRAEDAVAAAADAQRSLARAKWPASIGVLHVRMAIHTGTAQLRGGDYFGPTLNRTSRILELGHGEQILLSEPAATLLNGLPPNWRLKELGSHALRGIKARERVFQINAPRLRAEFPPIASHGDPSDNLPAHLSSFIGRRDELSRVRDLVRDHRLVTIAGPGGIGKTRLALEAAKGLGASFPDGIYFASFAPLDAGANIEAVATLVARTLGLREEPGETTVAALARGIGDRRLLLLADNVEHVLLAAGALIKELGVQNKNAHVLATGREPLHAMGETVERLSKLSTADAARLFSARSGADRARAGARDAAITREICARLDNIPLAVELAAARAAALGLPDLLRRLDRPFQVLVSKDPSEESRHKTLSATIAWSLDLLAPVERQVLECVSVFRGGFAMEGARSVCALWIAAADDVDDALESLVDKSLVMRSPSSDGRFDFMETIGAFAERSAIESGIEDSLRRFHFSYFRDQARRFHEGEIDRMTWLSLAARDIHNLSRAIRFGIDAGDEDVLPIVSAVSLYWEAYGGIASGRELVESAATAPVFERSPRIAAVLRRASTLATVGDDYAAARRFANAALAASERTGDAAGEVEARFGLAVVAQRCGDARAAEDEYRRCLAFFRTSGGRGIMPAANNLAQLVADRGDVEEARTFLAEARMKAEELSDDVALYDILGTSAAIERKAANPTAALAELQQCIEGWKRLERPGELSETLSLCAFVLLDLAKPAEALRAADRAVKLAAQTESHALHVMALESLGCALQADGQHVKAARCFGQAARIRERTRFAALAYADLTQAKRATRRDLGEPRWQTESAVDFRDFG